MYCMYDSPSDKARKDSQVDNLVVKAKNDLRNAVKLAGGEISVLGFRGKVYPDNVDDLVYTKELMNIYQKQLESGLTCMLPSHYLEELKKVGTDLCRIITLRNNIGFEVQSKSNVMYSNMIDSTKKYWTQEKLNVKVLEMRKNLHLFSTDVECMALMYAIEKRLLDFVI
ncbi:hypothetical protein COPG_00002 [Colwellia phage 9A]|uniref:Uncharacterized protein n=1 Tax=Colwellia phage 9A TaxID=765765 RepID=I3UM83_9CAUD|nr:hypothetical protein COPG_00002 [Colwellia phage 9A]AFK66598.1 hypothetical protein COPG_00002 [Colwellia phage 9A]